MSTQIKKNKNEFINDLREVFTQIKDDKKITDKIKNNMKKFRVLPGKVQEYINGQVEMREDDIELISILAEQTYIVTGKSLSNPLNALTEREMKEIKSNFEGYQSEKVGFPYTFKNVVKIADDDFICSIEASEINFLYSNGLLEYNPETQREGRQIKNKSNDEIITVPKVIEKNVKEMVELLEKNEIISSMITFNARLGTSENEFGELIYNEENKTLTITEGTLLDVLDGFHRINAISRALRKDPSIDAMFKLNILNYNKKRAIKYFAQMNKGQSVSESHLKKMSETRYGDFVAKQVQSNSQLSGKVAAGDHISPNSDLLVTFNTLSDGIDEIFNIENRQEALKVSEYLTEFFDTLFDLYPDEFINNISKTREETLLNTNVMFFGYLTLAKKMNEQNVKLNKLPKILNDIDFSRDNEMWESFNIIDANKRIKTTAKKRIINFFNLMEL
ncbi:DNA sulfur modification protein DndB [uncultured Metabacillus sp.]|uniref:DNA sulfur modification protein DndB n=1 Tax=uncultured Metabacillus sp. TaxID=2860135 RepID=UPI002602D66D|nr:DNA sulfur modification protein DndB [uncultured Metabacillus sp.]